LLIGKRVGETMTFNVVTLFPSLFEVWENSGVCGRAVKNGLVKVKCWNPREFSNESSGQIDDRPYGGGPGMVMMAEPLRATVNKIDEAAEKPARVLFFSPVGKVLSQDLVEDIAHNLEEQQYTLICGRYEGVDQRFIDTYVDEIVSIGDFILPGGECVALALMEAVIRRIPGTLGNEESSKHDSFMDGVLQFPHYTRPKVFESNAVPDVLLSGHHAKIKNWRRQKAIELTCKYRPDLVRLAIRKNLLSKSEILDFVDELND